MTHMVCSQTVASLPQHCGVAGVTLVFIDAALTMPSQKLVCCAASGLKGTEVRIDCTITDGPRLPAHVITYAEAKFTMKLHADHAEAVGQIWVRRQTNTMLCAYF